MRFIGFFFLLVILLVAGVLLAPQFIDWNQYKGQIISQIEDSTGFQASIDGDLDLAVLPMPRVVVNGLSVSNPAEEGDKLLTLDHADIYLEVMPLLSGNVSLKSITLNKPNISLRVAKDGSQNWMTDKLKPAETQEQEAASTTSDFSIGGLNIKDGRLSYTDSQKGSEQTISDINGSFSMKSLQGPFDVDASFVALGHPLHVNVQTEKLDAENKSITANLKVGYKGAELNFSGVVGYGEELDAQGETVLVIANMRSFMEAVSGSSQSSTLEIPVKTQGIVTLTQNNVSYTNLVASIGRETLKGSLKVENLQNYPKEPLKVVTDLSGDNNLLLDLTALYSAKEIDISKAKLAHGSSKLNGDIAYKFPVEDKKAKLDVDVSAPVLNIDELMSLSGSEKKSSSGQGLKEQSKSLILPMDTKIKFSADKVIYDSKTIEGLEVDASSSGSVLKISNLSFKDYAGAALLLQGDVADLATLTGLSFKGFFESADIEATLDALGQSAALKSAPTKIGKVALDASVSGHLDSLAFDTKLDALDATVTAKGIARGVETSPSFSDMNFGLKHANLAELLHKISPESEKNAALSKSVDLSSQVSLEDNVYKLSALNGSFGPISINGDITADMSGSVPSITGDLKTGKLPLETFMSKSSGAGSSGGGQAGKWSKEPLDTAWMQSANINLKMSSSEISYGGWQFDNPSFGFILQDGTMSLKDWTAGLFGGTSQLSLQMSGGETVRTNTALKLDKVGLQSLVVALAGAPVVQSAGVADFDVELATSGKSMHDLINALAGKGTVQGTDITVRGINVSELARAMGGTDSLGTQARVLFSSGIKGGTSKFEKLDGEFTVNKGIVNFSKLNLLGQDATVATNGNISLPAWTIDMKSSVQLIVPADQETPPPFEISYRGSLSNPGSSFAQNALENYLNKKLADQANKLIQDKLGDKLDGELGNIVGGLLGAPQPQQEPANNNQQQQAPSPYQKDSAKKEEPKEIDPEDVVKDVLKGFLR